MDNMKAQGITGQFASTNVHRFKGVPGGAAAGGAVGAGSALTPAHMEKAGVHKDNVMGQLQDSAVLQQGGGGTSPFAAMGKMGMGQGMPGMPGGMAMNILPQAMMGADMMNMMMLSNTMGQRGGTGSRNMGAANYQGMTDMDQLMNLMGNKQREQADIFRDLTQTNQQGSAKMRSNQMLQKKTAGFSKMEKSYSMQERMMGMKETMLKGMGKTMTGMATGLQAAAKGLDAAAKAVEAASTAVSAIPVIGTAIGAAMKIVAKVLQGIAKVMQGIAKTLKGIGKKMEAMGNQMGVKKKGITAKKVKVKAQQQRSTRELQKGYKEFQNIQKSSQNLSSELNMNYQHQTAIQRRLQELGTQSGGAGRGRENGAERNPMGGFGNAFGRMQGIQGQKAMQMQAMGAGMSMASNLGMMGMMGMSMGMPGMGMSSPMMGGGMPLMGGMF